MKIYVCSRHNTTQSLDEQRLTLHPIFFRVFRGVPEEHSMNMRGVNNYVELVAFHVQFHKLFTGDVAASGISRVGENTEEMLLS
jgi:hypothetical protein